MDGVISDPVLRAASCAKKRIFAKTSKLNTQKFAKAIDGKTPHGQPTQGKRGHRFSLVQSIIGVLVFGVREAVRRMLETEA